MHGRRQLNGRLEGQSHSFKYNGVTGVTVSETRYFLHRPRWSIEDFDIGKPLGRGQLQLVVSSSRRVVLVNSCHFRQVREGLSCQREKVQVHCRVEGKN